jgi:hypothetical protein
MAGEAPENTQETQVFIHSLEELNKKLSESIEGFSKIEEGSLISIGKAGQDTWNVFKVESISETGLSLYDGNEGGAGVETISFQDLFNAHKRLRLKGLGKHAGASGLLSLMQNHSTKKDTWAGMEIRQNDAGEDEFDFTDRRFDSVKHRKHYFVGRDGRIVEILSLADGTITARIGEKYNEKENTASWGEEHEYPIQYLAHFMIRFSVEPKNSPYREIAQRPVEEHTEHGRLKHIFGRLSIHDVFSGGKKFFEEFKHKLEHGNHMQEHRVMLGIADKL